MHDESQRSEAVVMAEEPLLLEEKFNPDDAIVTAEKLKLNTLPIAPAESSVEAKPLS